MHRRTTSIVLASLSMSCIAGTAFVLAGPLDPPAGPVAPTYRTLAEIEPRIPLSAATTPGDADSVFRITQRGSYYLTGNLLGQAGKHGIEITVSNVTIDLMGYELTGAAGTLDGVRVTGSQAQITIRNGSVSLWREAGLNLSAASDCIIEGVRAAVNSGIGLRVANTSVVTNCVFQGNGADGVVTGTSCTLTSCTARNNNGRGIVLYDGGTALSCTASGNRIGFQIAAGAVATACVARTNTERGMNIFASGAVVNCTAQFNGEDGFVAASHASVTDCRALSNGSAGTYAGILLTGTGARIDGNHIANNDYGIQSNGSENTIIRNSCRSNLSGNYNLTMLNEDCAEIVSAAINATRTYANLNTY